MSKRRTWSNELIISEIANHHDNGVNLNSVDIIKIDKPLYCASCSYFGSWKNAVKCAGFEYTGIVPNEITISGKDQLIKVTNKKGY